MNKNNPTVIEIKKDATEKQIEILQKMNPNSKILRKDSEELKEFYDSIKYKE